VNRAEDGADEPGDDHLGPDEATELAGVRAEDAGQGEGAAALGEAEG